MFYIITLLHQYQKERLLNKYLINWACESFKFVKTDPSKKIISQLNLCKNLLQIMKFLCSGIFGRNVLEAKLQISIQEINSGCGV